MRPRTLEDFVGQEHLLGSGRVLRRTLETDQVPSMVLWGPPGSGKTTLAEVVAAASQSRFVRLSAVSSGVADLRREVDAARKLCDFTGQKTILFIDEIHRFNRGQQDAILPYVENGTVTLIGATTENPSFEVNSALLSRVRVFRLEKLSDEEIRGLVNRALLDRDRGLGSLKVTMETDALNRLSRLSDGDARIALNALELAVNAAAVQDGKRSVSSVDVEDAMQRPSLLYDKSGDMHYHLISALIKSVRGSDPDASVYWLGRMLEAGEDPMFVARRLLILASEDVGLADPGALPLASACHQAVHSLGMPEAYLPLTECTLYLALAPKSNSTIATYGNVMEDVRATLNEPVPLHLRNAVTSYNASLGYGKGYKYSHDFEDHYVEQQYLPDGLKERRYYAPTTEGEEETLYERLKNLRDRR